MGFVIPLYTSVCVCVFFPSILDIKFVGRTSRGHTGGRSHRIFNPPSCGVILFLWSSPPVVSIFLLWRGPCYVYEFFRPETFIDASCVSPHHATLRIRPSFYLFKTLSPSLWRGCINRPNLMSLEIKCLGTNGDRGEKKSYSADHEHRIVTNLGSYRAESADHTHHQQVSYYCPGLQSPTGRH